MSARPNPPGQRPPRRPRARIAGVCIWLLVAFVSAIASAPASAQPACNCGDLRDLVNRICEARAASAEYRRLTNTIRGAERNAGRPMPFTDADYENLVQPCVQEAINQVSDFGARRGTAETDNSCNMSFKSPPPTACLRGSLTAHESVHVTACQAIRNSRDGFFKEFRDLVGSLRERNQTMVDMLNEERAAYTTEISYARQQLDRLRRDGKCPELTPGNPLFNARWVSPDPCPPPRPRPPPAQSACGDR